MMIVRNAFKALVIFILCFNLIICAKDKKPKKDIRDYTDAEIEAIYDEWEENDDEKLSEDELPEYKRKPPNLNINDLKNKNPEEISRLSKKGKSIMIFITVSDNPTKEETEQITTIWQTSLFNANYEIQRYIIEDNRAIFMISDGSLAWEIKDFLVKQDRCEDVSIDNQVYDGKAKLNRKNSKIDL